MVKGDLRQVLAEDERQGCDGRLFVQLGGLLADVPASTHDASGTLVTLWAPEGVCSPTTTSNASDGKRPSRHSSDAQRRRCTRVIRRLISRMRARSGESASALIVAKIRWLCGCAHHCRGWAPPTTSWATFVTGPRPDSRSTPSSTRRAATSPTTVSASTRRACHPITRRLSGAIEPRDCLRRWWRPEPGRVAAAIGRIFWGRPHRDLGVPRRSGHASQPYTHRVRRDAFGRRETR